jgi:uncharacterized protein YcbK (DUF882 family)
MGDMTTHFNRSEFACRGENCCGHSAPINYVLVASLEHLRGIAERLLTILSGYRCNRHNAETPGAAADSQHCLGTAADVLVPDGMTAEQLARMAAIIPAFAAGGIGMYDTWVHLDIRRDGPARWDKRTRVDE